MISDPSLYQFHLRKRPVPPWLLFQLEVPVRSGPEYKVKGNFHCRHWITAWLQIAHGKEFLFFIFTALTDFSASWDQQSNDHYENELSNFKNSGVIGNNCLENAS